MSFSEGEDAAAPSLAEPSIAKPSSPPRKIKRVKWVKLEPINPLADAKFDFEHIDSLWYCNMDYFAFLHQ